ncbi:kinesin family member 20/23 [Exophiala viscosa]|uniref:Kinesin-like protein n=1 Tax=Exophiala viscosa TaxID=2486360 RepID=A0AAN6IGY3_9EURO|nr:kinesin family member 20/23 [Exophiala viscosa]
MATQTSLFQVYLRLRPPIDHQLPTQKNEPWLIVESANSQRQDAHSSFPTHITLQPPNDSRKRAIERFGFTKIFDEAASQLDVFQETGTADTIKTVLQTGRDGLVATLGVTGSGKSHTILGSKSQRGLTQMSLDVLFRSIGQSIRRPSPTETALLSSIQASDVSEAQILSATTFLESVYGDSDRGRLSRAQTPMSRAQTPMMDSMAHTMRKAPLPRPSTFPQHPNMSSFSIEVESRAEYVVLVSMYEVYNDRIFDLLSTQAPSNGPAMSTRQGAALQKGLLRRPLLFKNTEMSPDKKVVAGLRKIVCANYDEAMLVLETGLTERRVAGTGSNSVSSRSHGFFCIEVKKKTEMQGHAAYVMPAWTGGTMSIVDLAGSERARNAKTTGSTLAEAGKINESLMYLGQCLQVQSDCQLEGSKPIVPFRQCKLTELLFSNSFPSSTHASSYRQPQKAVMIVTADPLGDFNATSQILRYSALAREVTVPRIPSVTSAILGGPGHGRTIHSGRTTPHDMPNSYFSAQELEQATNEASRLGEECDALAMKLAEEEIKRTEAELKLQAAEDKLVVMEQEVREECWNEMDQHLEEEKERWREAWEHEKMQNEAFVDGKLEILEKTARITIHEDQSSDSRVEDLERENDTLRAKIRAFEQEMQTRSPTKKSRTAPKSPVKGLVLQETSNSNIATNPFLASLRTREDSNATVKPRSSEDHLQVADVSPRKLSLRSSSVGQATDEEEPPATVKKQRKLTARKWDLGDPAGF